jgi:hypothetical protein
MADQRAWLRKFFLKKSIKTDKIRLRFSGGVSFPLNLGYDSSLGVEHLWNAGSAAPTLQSYWST